jgi:hypothetical protein
MNKRFKILFLLIFFLGFSLTQAQRPPCNPDYISLSYEGRIPDHFPKLKLDMPYETMLYYIWCNDWCHNYEDKGTWNYFKNKSFDDEFKEMIKRLYITQDYNPILFVEHLFYNDTLMKTSPYCLQYYLNDRLYYIVPEKQIHYSLMESEIIVRIKTTDIVEREFDGDGYIITSEVQDVIKGKIIPTCKDITIPDTPDEYVRPEPYFQINEPGKCFQFVFNHKYSEDFLEFGQIGNEYIVFIDLMPFYADSHPFTLCTDSLNNCYYLSKITKYPYFGIYYIFLIKNDIVLDYSFLLNYGDSLLTYNEWRQKLQEKIDEILNENYTSVDDNIINNSDISVYPNPADDFIYIKNKDLIDYTISINNLLGQQLIVKKSDNVSNINHIDISEIPSGVYFIVTESAKSRKVVPIVIR